MAFDNLTSRIVLDTSQFEQGANRVAQAAARLEASGRNINASLTNAGGAIDRVGERSAASSTDLLALSAALATVAAAATRFVQVGIQTAGQLEAIDRRFLALTGSAENAARAQAAVTAAAQRFGAPVIAAQEAVAGLIPLIGTNNAELERYTELITRLASLRPEQGFGGAAFAISEAITAFRDGRSDFISLVERFGLTTSAIRQALAATGDFGDGLDQVLNQFGATAVTAQAAGQSFEASAVRAQEAFAQAAAVGAEPLRDVLTSVLNVATSLFTNLSQNNPTLLQFATGAAAVTAAVATLTAGIGALNFALSTLRTTAPGAAAAIGRLSVAPIAITGGAALGDFALRELANRGVTTGDIGRFAGPDAEEPLQVVGERLAQALTATVAFIGDGLEAAGDSLISIAGIFDVGGALLQSAFDFVRAAIEFGGSALEGAFGQIVVAIGNALVGLQSIGQRAGLNLGVGDAAIGFINEGNRISREALVRNQTAAGRLSQGIGVSPEQAAEIAARTEQRRADLANGLGVFDDAALALGRFLGVIDPIEQAVTEVTRTAESAVNPLADLANAYREASADIEDIRQELRDEQARVNEERGIQGGRDEEDFLRQRLRAISGFYQSLAEQDAQAAAREAEAAAGIEEIRADALEQEGETLARAYQQQQRAAEDHQARILDISQRGAQALEDAIAEGDRAAARRAVRDTQQELQRTQQEFDVKRRREDEDLQATIDNLREQRDERITAALQQLDDLRADNQARRDETIAGFNERIALEDEDRRIRLQRQQEDYAREDELRVQAAQQREQRLLQELEATNNFVEGQLQAYARIREEQASVTADALNQLLGVGPRPVPGVSNPQPPNFGVGGLNPLLFPRPAANDAAAFGVAGTGMSVNVSVNAAGSTFQNLGDIDEVSNQIANTAARRLNEEIRRGRAQTTVF